MRSLLVVLTAGSALVLAVPASAAIDGASAPSAGAAIPRLYKNCTNFNKRYPHGVGKRRARDRSPDPVTNFRRSTLIYNQAMRWNKGLDRDKDGVACEKQ